MRIKKIIITGLAALTMGLVAGCGAPGETSEPSCGLCGNMGDVRGSISSKTGSQIAMQGWAVGVLERDTGMARVGEVDAAGLFTLKKVRSSAPQTLALFTPDYILQAVLSIPGEVPNTIHQFVEMKSPHLPQLINNGPIISFQNYSGISVTRELAADRDGDLIPDGAAHIQGLSLQAPGALDSDLDGTVNDKDPDIDGDGVINVLDPDDDGDELRDAFDPDANADYYADSAPDQTDVDLYFKEGVEYITVRYEQIPQGDGTTQTTLRFLTKVRDDVAPNTVQIRGAPSLLNTSTFSVPDPSTGLPVDQPWNRLLSDDGASEDGSAGDRIFAKTVKLPAGKAPRSYEAVFFQLSFGPSDDQYFVEFPYVFPDLKPGAVSASYNALTRTVLLAGTPFGQLVEDFVWTIYLYKADGTNVWSSQAIPGSTREFAIPESQVQADQTYTFEVVAQTLDKVPGHPAYVIHSQMADLK